MQTDEKRQAKGNWSAKLKQQNQKIEIQYNDGIHYIGQVPLMLEMNTQKLIDKIRNAEAQIITKTTCQMKIQIGFIFVTLFSACTLEIMKLKARIVELENQIKLTNLSEENKKSELKCPKCGSNNINKPYSMRYADCNAYTCKLDHGNGTSNCINASCKQCGHRFN